MSTAKFEDQATAKAWAKTVQQVEQVREQALKAYDNDTEDIPVDVENYWHNKEMVQAAASIAARLDDKTQKEIKKAERTGEPNPSKELFEACRDRSRAQADGLGPLEYLLRGGDEAHMRESQIKADHHLTVQDSARRPLLQRYADELLKATSFSGIFLAIDKQTADEAEAQKVLEQCEKSLTQAQGFTDTELPDETKRGSLVKTATEHVAEAQKNLVLSREHLEKVKTSKEDFERFIMEALHGDSSAIAPDIARVVEVIAHNRAKLGEAQLKVKDLLYHVVSYLKEIADVLKKECGPLLAEPDDSDCEDDLDHVVDANGNPIKTADEFAEVEPMLPLDEGKRYLQQGLTRPVAVPPPSLDFISCCGGRTDYMPPDHSQYNP